MIKKTKYLIDLEMSEKEFYTLYYWLREHDSYKLLRKLREDLLIQHENQKEETHD